MAEKASVSLPDDGTGAVVAGSANGGPKQQTPPEPPKKPGMVIDESTKKVTLNFSNTGKKKKKKGGSTGAPAPTPPQEPAPAPTTPAPTPAATAPPAEPPKAEEKKAEPAPAAEKKTPPPAPPAPARAAAPAKTKAAAKSPSPFKKPEGSRRRVKLFVFGDTGTGKTTLACQFPSPAFIDMDGGTEPYKDTWSFEVNRTVNVDEVAASVRWLAEQIHEYRTLVIDPITIYWEALQKKWSDIFLVRNKKSKGYKFEFYDMQVKDWNTVKAEMKALIRAILALDMNIVVTAREKTKYKDGEYMQSDGVTFDGDKSLPYMFDTVLRLAEEGGKRVAYCLKDRWHLFPQGRAFALDYSVIEELWGKEQLDRQATQVILPPEEEQYDEGAQKISPDRLRTLNDLVKIVKLPLSAAQKGFAAHGVERADDLTPEQGEQIIEKLKAMRDSGGYQEKPKK